VDGTEEGQDLRLSMSEDLESKESSHVVHTTAPYPI
jgi:hypothetical protein